MKMMNLGAWGRWASVFLISLALVLVVTGCPEGPAGPAGPAGEPGEAAPPNATPVAAVTALTDVALVTGEDVMFDVGPNFSDPNQDSLTFTAVSLDPSVATASATGSTVKVTAVAAGTTIVVVTATDPGGLAASATASVTVTDPPPTTDPDKPIAVGRLAAMNLTLDVTTMSKTIDVMDYFSDPNGDKLVYSAAAESAVEGLVSIYIEGSMITFTPAKEGTATVTVSATDPDGNSASQVFSLTVAKPGDPPPNLSDCSAALDVGESCTVTIGAGQVLESQDSQRASVARVALSTTDWKVTVHVKGDTTIRVLNNSDRTIATTFVVTGKNRPPALTAEAKRYQSENLLKVMSMWDRAKQLGKDRPTYLVQMDRADFITDGDGADDIKTWKVSADNASVIVVDYLDGSLGTEKGYIVDLTSQVRDFNIMLSATDKDGASSEAATIGVRGTIPRSWSYDVEQFDDGSFLVETIGMRKDVHHTLTFLRPDPTNTNTHTFEFIKDLTWTPGDTSLTGTGPATGNFNPSTTVPDTTGNPNLEGITNYLKITPSGPIRDHDFVAATGTTDETSGTLKVELTGGLGAASIRFDYMVYYDKDTTDDSDTPPAVNPAWHSVANKTLHLNIVAVTP